jgi:putative ABC transport system permease protein
MKFLFLVWKGLARRKIRTGLTLLSIFIAFLMFGLLSAMNEWFSGKLVGGNFSERLIVQSLYGMPLPMGYYEKIRNMQGVAADEVTYNSQLLGYYQNQDNQFFQQAVNAESFLRMQRRYYSLSPGEEQAWLGDKAGAVIGRKLADRFGWKIGDRVPVISAIHPPADHGAWQLNIRGILEPRLDGVPTDFMVLHFDYMAEGRGGIYDVFWFALNVSDPSQADAVAQRIDDEFRNSSAPTSTSTIASLIQQFSSQFGNFGMIAGLILGAVFFTMLLVTGNAMMQAFRERIHELAVLRSIGFSGMALLYLLLAESMCIVLIGGLPGIGLLWVLRGPLQSLSNGLYMRPQVMLQALGLMLVMGFLVGIIPALKAKRLTIVDALRRR